MIHPFKKVIHNDRLIVDSAPESFVRLQDLACIDEY